MRLLGVGGRRAGSPVRRGPRRSAAAGALVLAGTALGVAVPTPALARAPVVAPASPVCVPRAGPVRTGLRLVSEHVVAPRLTDLTLLSEALDRTVHVDVLVPTGYASRPARRYPVLYLLHGLGGSYRDWPDHGVERIVGTLPVVVVMPDGGTEGWYTNWYGTDLGERGPPPAWESFDLDELVPYIDAHYRVLADRDGRAIAGLSMGGFGAMSYAARHPSMFAVAGSFSGAVDTDLAYPAGPVGLTAAVGALEGPGQPIPACVWGDPVTEDVRWRDHDPTYLAQNLHGVALFLAWGNGVPGPYDRASAPDPSASGLEAGISLMNQAFVAALERYHVPFTARPYGPGTHSWPYFERDLAWFLPFMERAFAHPPAAPPAVAFSFRSADRHFEAWGFRFATDNPARTFTELEDVTRAGFRAAGFGTLRVVTARWYAPGRPYAVAWRVWGPGGARSGEDLVEASRAGRLRFAVPLGPPATVQQYAFGTVATASFPHAVVTIAPASVPPHGRQRTSSD